GVTERWPGGAPWAVYVPEADADPRAPADEAAARSAMAENTPRWWLARRELPRGPTLKVQRGVLAREAARWTDAFPQLIAPAHRRVAPYHPADGPAIVGGRAGAVGRPAGPR